MHVLHYNNEKFKGGCVVQTVIIQ